jgi:hypothetical protein
MIIVTHSSYYHEESLTKFILKRMNKIKKLAASQMKIF